MFLQGTFKFSCCLYQETWDVTLKDQNHRYVNSQYKVNKYISYSSSVLGTLIKVPYKFYRTAKTSKHKTEVVPGPYIHAQSISPTPYLSSVCVS